MLSFRSCKAVKKKKRTIVVGLNSDSSSREMLLRLLISVVKAGDSVTAVHVEEADADAFDPNSFHTHEDLCKSKKVDFQVKVCITDSYVSELPYQVRISYATILVLGCSLSGPSLSAINTCLKGLPPSCTLLVMDTVGRILLEGQGTSQQGSVRAAALQSSQSFSSTYPCSDKKTNITPQLQKSLTVPASSTGPSIRPTTRRALSAVNRMVEVSDLVAEKLFHRLALLEAEGSIRNFAPQELRYATNNFNSAMVIGEGGHSKVYRAKLGDGQDAAVKVLKSSHCSAVDFFREVDLFSSMKHESIVQIIGFCNNKEVQAIVYNLLKGSLRQNLRQLRWSERMKVAIGVAKALDYLHHSHNPPIIHRDVKSSNILLSQNCEPILSDFGAAMFLQQASANTRAPFDVVGTFGYLAPEYMMYGKVDEKIDVYSYGVVLLELITGKEAIQTDQEIRESLVLWARSLMCSGIWERLIDPNLVEDYNKEEMEMMMIAARLCLMHSSSRRPTMKMILRFFEKPEHWLRMQRERDDFLNGIDLQGETAGP